MRPAWFRAAALATATATAGCSTSCVTRSFDTVVTVSGDEAADKKVRRVAALATPERLARLKLEVKQRLPQVTDPQLAGLRVMWRETTFLSLLGKGRSTKVILIARVYHDGSFDPKPISRTASAILEAELNGSGPPTVSQPVN